MSIEGGQTTSDNGPTLPYGGDHLSYSGSRSEVSVQILPLELTLSGTTRHSNEDCILQGQRCSGVLELQGVTGVQHYPEFSHGGDIELSGHVWDVPGNTFLDFDVTPPSGVVTLPTAGHWQQASPYWYWRGPAELGQGLNAVVMDIACDVNATCAEGSLGTLSGKAKVKNFRPFYAMLPTAGPVNWFVPWPVTVGVRAGPNGLTVESDAPGESGISIGAYVESQDWFRLGPDSGSFVWSQLCQLERYMNGLPIVPNWFFLTYKHDGPFPYRGPLPAHSHNIDFAYDNPSWPVLHGPGSSYAVADEYRNFVLYKPPGDDSRFTPLAYVYWNWDSLGNSPYFFVPLGNVYATEYNDTETHPIWAETRS